MLLVRTASYTLFVIAFTLQRLSRLTPEEEKLLKIIKLAYEVATSTGELTPKPEKMTDGRWLVLLICRRTQGPILRQYVWTMLLRLDMDMYEF